MPGRSAPSSDDFDHQRGCGSFHQAGASRSLPADNTRRERPANPSAQPPADALLWRVQGRHHEVVCYVVAVDAGVVLCVASDGENDLLVAESHPTLADAIERASVLRASLTAHGLPPESEID